MLGVTSPQGVSPVTLAAVGGALRLGAVMGGLRHGHWLLARHATRLADLQRRYGGAHRRRRDLYSGVISGKGRSDEDNRADRRHELGIDPDLLPAHQPGSEGAAGWAALRPAGALQRRLRRDRSAAAPRRLGGHGTDSWRGGPLAGGGRR